MNYFKGNGRCGVATSPNYIKEKEKDSVEKLTLNPDTPINDISIKNLAENSYISTMIFTD